MIRKHLITLIITFGCLQVINAQKIEKVEAEAIDGKIRVTCSLQTKQHVDLSISYSEDNGNSFLPCRTLSGDLMNQLSGHKQLIWDCGKDGIIMGSFVFIVNYSLSENPPPDR
ncbi:hypothetical protein M2480_000965 [Parabacteroides sp. PFB2-12]|nr:hypothetical protein [Parabacteroides sp. PM6-13]MDH6389999.1 hypothetical protein [Parabacteroides sp. PFB2-12]